MNKLVHALVEHPKAIDSLLETECVTLQQVKMILNRRFPGANMSLRRYFEWLHLTKGLASSYAFAIEQRILSGQVCLTLVPPPKVPLNMSGLLKEIYDLTRAIAGVPDFGRGAHDKTKWSRALVDFFATWAMSSPRFSMLSQEPSLRTTALLHACGVKTMTVICLEIVRRAPTTFARPDVSYLSQSGGAHNVARLYMWIMLSPTQRDVTLPCLDALIGEEYTPFGRAEWHSVARCLTDQEWLEWYEHAESVLQWCDMRDIFQRLKYASSQLEEISLQHFFSESIPEDDRWDNDVACERFFRYMGLLLYSWNSNPKSELLCEQDYEHKILPLMEHHFVPDPMNPPEKSPGDIKICDKQFLQWLGTFCATVQPTCKKTRRVYTTLLLAALIHPDGDLECCWADTNVTLFEVIGILDKYHNAKSKSLNYMTFAKGVLFWDGAEEDEEHEVVARLPPVEDDCKQDARASAVLAQNAATFFADVFSWILSDEPLCKAVTANYNIQLVQCWRRLGGKYPNIVKSDAFWQVFRDGLIAITDSEVYDFMSTHVWASAREAALSLDPLLTAMHPLMLPLPPVRSSE